jgi:hypothetical protein
MVSIKVVKNFIGTDKETVVAGYSDITWETAIRFPRLHCR